MDWLLKNARLTDNTPLQDIALAEGRISAIGANLTATDQAQIWDLAGRVVLPGLIEAHAHLDKTYTSITNQSGTLLEAIKMWHQIKPKRTYADIQTTARQALDQAIRQGVTAVRSHIDIGAEADLQGVQALLDVRQAYTDLLDIQFVALGAAGGSPENRTTLAQAMAMGVDIVGGAPALMPNPEEDIDAALDLAEQLNCPVDLHIDETEDPNSLTLEYLADQTSARGLQGRVTAGHCCSLAFVDQATAARVIEKVAAAQIHVVTLPSTNLVLIGRGFSPPPRGITRVKELLAHGVNVCAASDNVYDPFNPFGGYDLLHIANLNAHVAHMSGESELETSLAMVTSHPAKALGLDTGLTVGSPADLIVIDALQRQDAVLSLPPRLATFKRGQLIVRTAIEQTWHAQPKQ
ncbi:MAG: amidohydrolase family protein [Chloroflexota bacterium]